MTWLRGSPPCEFGVARRSPPALAVPGYAVRSGVRARGRLQGARPLAGQPPVGADQPEVPDHVRDFGAPARLEVAQQVELAGVVGAVMEPTESDDARGVVAPAEAAGRQVGGRQ